MSRQPIEHYALLSDCHTGALVGKDGSVDWLCFPRFDSPAVLGRLLDEEAGSWELRPVDDFESERSYRPGSLVLQTTFRTDSGTVVLTDALAIGPNEGGHELGAGAPHALLRRVECTEGTVEMEMSLTPRPEYGLVLPLHHRDEGGMNARGGASVLRLSTGTTLDLEDSTTRARFELNEGDRALFALQHRTSSEDAPEPWTTDDIEDRLDETERGWRRWSATHQTYQGPWRELVRHSGRVLRGLTYHPTGAMVAAPTTSLPEEEGGERNWDYRYTWLRDASFTLEALAVAACPHDAHRFFDFLTHAALTRMRRDRDLQIMYGVGGEHDLTERKLEHLSGWRDSRPVRVGNAAWSQRQLDVYGEILGAAHRLREYVQDFDAVSLEFLSHLADTAAERWQEPDHGIWEIRAEPRPFLYSKLMCWVAVDRALDMADILGAEESRLQLWSAARDRIRSAILEKGWSDEVGAFTQSFGSRALDASSLMIPIVGFLPPDDDRVRATVEATEERLTDEHGLVYRYLTDDGLPGEEGVFLLCSFWLAQARAMAGEVEQAREVFERATVFLNDVHLLSEEVDPEGECLMGNFPQAFSHIGLINAAWAIYEAEGE